MLKEWTVRILIVFAVFIFLLNDILNLDIVKSRFTKELKNLGVTVENIEKISLSEITLQGVVYQKQRIDKASIQLNTVHLCANVIKWFLKRDDYLQEFSVLELEGSIENLPILLDAPVTCCATPTNLTHESVKLKIGSGIAIIHKGELQSLAQKIDLHHIPLPQSQFKISGVIELSKKAFNLKVRNRNKEKPISAYIKGIWNHKFETSFAGSATLAKFDKVDFAGRATPSFDNLQNSLIDIRGNWNGTLRQLYSVLESDFKLVQGNISLDWNLKGPVASPSIGAKAKITKGTFEVPAIGLFLKDLQASIEGSDLYWVVKDLKAYDSEKSDGVLQGTGWLDLSRLSKDESGFDYHLNLAIDNVAVLMMENLTGVCSGNVELNGDHEGILLKGKALVHHIELIVDKALSTKKQPLSIVFTDELPAVPQKSYPVLFDIDLQLEKPGIVSGQNLIAKWTGHAKLGGTTTDLQLVGDLKLLEGEYRLNGKSVTIKEGLIKFNGNLLKDTSLFAIATIELKEMIAEIIVRGHLETLTLTLRSNPPLPQREILSWILFNQGAKHITSLQGEQLNKSLSEFTKGGGHTNMLSDIQGKLGIDRIDLDRRGLGTDEEVSLKLGKYLSKNLFVGVSKGINSDVNRIGFEASLNEHWKVQGEIGDNSEGQMHLKWKTDY